MRSLSAVFLALAFLLPAAIAQDTPKPLPVLDVTSMDKTVDPCTDFYTYSCGGWMNANPIPPDKTSWTVTSKLADTNKLILRDVLETAAKPDATRDATNQKIGDYYAACVDEKAIDAAGAKPIQPSLDRIAAVRSKSELAELAATLVDTNILFNFLPTRITRIDGSHCRDRSGGIGASRPRLLLEERRQVGGTSQGLCEPCAEDVGTAGRPTGQGSERSGDGVAH